MSKKASGLETAVSKKVGRAIFDYRMVADGDKILVAVSGGKDSLVLLKILSDRRSFVPIKYDLVAVHVDFQGGRHGVDRSLLKEHLKRQGVPFYFKKAKLRKGKGRENRSCFWCAWNRRKVLFELAAKYACNKLALGHHKDDIIETILMNLFFEGEISAMVPRQKMFEGKVTIIRPLAYVEKCDITKLAQRLDLPVAICRCPQSQTSNRRRMADLIQELEKKCPGVKTNIFRSLQRIKKDYLL
ncbi:MAG: tRNA lysidine(34) synthetase TilS [Candidatus Omnitrophota bacterium]